MVDLDEVIGTHAKTDMLKVEATIRALKMHLEPSMLSPAYYKRWKSMLYPPDVTWGHCYIMAEAVYHHLGGKAAYFTPMQTMYEGESHWYLRWEPPWGIEEEPISGYFFVDPTREQFDRWPGREDYERGKPRGFLTKHPSARAADLLSQAALHLP